MLVEWTQLSLSKVDAMPVDSLTAFESKNLSMLLELQLLNFYTVMVYEILLCVIQKVLSMREDRKE